MQKNNKPNKEEELPSFLKKIFHESESVIPKVNRKTSNDYLGPIFFGGCYPFHPPPHAISVGYSHQIQHQFESKESIANLFLARPESVRKSKKIKFFELKQEKHRLEKVEVPEIWYCGTRKVFKPEVNVHVVDLGESASEIENEFLQEIPLCRFKNPFPSPFSNAVQEITLSDIREKKLPYLSEKERSAHAHFPKQMVKTKVIGPTIPAAITVTKLPTKRKRTFLADLQVPPAMFNCNPATRPSDTVQDSKNISCIDPKITQVIFPVKKKL